MILKRHSRRLKSFMEEGASSQPHLLLQSRSSLCFCGYRSASVKRKLPSQQADGERPIAVAHHSLSRYAPFGCGGAVAVDSACALRLRGLRALMRVPPACSYCGESEPKWEIMSLRKRTTRSRKRRILSSR
jgi:hypothetical protein